MTKQEIYERIVRLTSEIQATNVVEKIFSAAKEGDPNKVEEVFETFKNENADLYQEIIKFQEDYDADYLVTVDIFGAEEDIANGAYIYDADIINAESFYVLMLFAQIDEFLLFKWGTESSMKYVIAIKVAGYSKLAHFIDNTSVFDLCRDDYSVFQCLVDIFTGELKL